MQETWVGSLGQEDSLEKEMDIHYSILAWETPWTKEPGGVQSMDLQRIEHDCTTIIFKLMRMDMKTPDILQEVNYNPVHFFPVLSFYASYFMTNIIY